MIIFYRKERVNEADNVSRRLDLFHLDDVYMRMPCEMSALWWDSQVPQIFC